MSRKPLAALAASVTVLVAAGVALAHGGGPATTQSVSAAFDATTVSKLASRTCTGGDGSYTMTKATYTGTATSTDARFAGTVTVKAHTLYNTDTNLGTVDGRFRIESTGGRSEGHFRAVDNDGTLSGMTDGHAGDPHAKLLGTLSATFDPETGFQGAQLGDGSVTGAAVLTTGRCEGPKGDKPPHGKKGKSGKKGKHGKKPHR